MNPLNPVFVFPRCAPIVQLLELKLLHVSVSHSGNVRQARKARLPFEYDIVVV